MVTITLCDQFHTNVVAHILIITIKTRHRDDRSWVAVLQLIHFSTVPCCYYDFTNYSNITIGTMNLKAQCLKFRRIIMMMKKRTNFTLKLNKVIENKQQLHVSTQKNDVIFS